MNDDRLDDDRLDDDLEALDADEVVGGNGLIYMPNVRPSNVDVGRAIEGGQNTAIEGATKGADIHTDLA